MLTFAQFLWNFTCKCMIEYKIFIHFISEAYFVLAYETPFITDLFEGPLNVIHEEIKKNSHNQAQVQHLYESYFLLLKKPALFEIQRYVFDSLLKHQLSRYNTFALTRYLAMRCINWKCWRKVLEILESDTVSIFRWHRKRFLWTKNNWHCCCLKQFHCIWQSK